MSGSIKDRLSKNKSKIMKKSNKKISKKVENIRYARDLRCTIADFCGRNIPDYELTYDTGIDRSIGISLTKYGYKNSAEMKVPIPHSFLAYAPTAINRILQFKNDPKSKFKTVAEIKTKNNVDIFWFGRKLEESGYYVISCEPRFVDTLFIVRKLEQKDMVK